MTRDPVEDETERIRRVYDGYASDEGTRARWDPEDPGNRLMLAERDRLLDGALAQVVAGATAGHGPPVIVDLGCGDGRVLVAAMAAAPGAWAGLGIDLLETRLRVARATHAALPLVVANGAALPLADRSVDAVVAFTVFSSIRDPAVAAGVAAEIARAVRPAGHVIWYDLRRDNPRNAEVHGVSAGEVARLFPGWSVSLRTCTVAPPLARRAARLSTRSYDLLARIPALRSHHFGVLTAPAVRP